MKVTVKAGGMMIDVNVLKSDVMDFVKKNKHLCGSCKALLCPTRSKLASELVKAGLQTCDRYYVFKCDGYEKNYYVDGRKPDKPDEALKKYGARTYNIVHPEIRRHFM